jgi:hypothetical protein
MPTELFFPDLGDLAQARLLLPPDLCGIRQAAGPRVQYPDVAFGFANEMLWKKQAIGPVRLAAFSPTECFQQTVQKHCLAFQDLKPRLGNAEPGRAVELRK